MRSPLSPTRLSSVKWHEGERGNQTAQTFTVFKRGQQGIGFGDVFREMLWGLRYAAATNRLLFISDEQTPVLLSSIFEPSNINWQLPDRLRETVSGIPFIESRVLTMEDQAPLAAQQHLVSDGINMADQASR